MNENHTIQLAEIPIGGRGGAIWNVLHGEREDICEALIKDFQPASQAHYHQELLQARLRTIDDALDRLMSGSYGICSKCGRTIEDAVLDVDAAKDLCAACVDRQSGLTGKKEDQLSVDESRSKVILENLNSFDTILLRTLNSDYRILLLDPGTGRSLIEGGTYLIEPKEALVRGSALPGEPFDGGAIDVGCRLEMWIDEKVFLTSPIKSIVVRHNAAVESIQNISARLH